MDTDAIRRAWPEVLGRVFQSRRITWTFVSQHAQVLSYTNGVLTLGISTAGLTNTFRQGNHAEIVRQALIDELGVEARVEGVHAAEVTPTDPYPEDPNPPAPASGAGTAPADGAATAAPQPAAAAPSPQPNPSHQSRGADAGGPSGGGAPKAPSAMADAGLSPASGRSLETNAGWGSVNTPAPDWASAASSPPPDFAAPASAAPAAPTPPVSPARSSGAAAAPSNTASTAPSGGAATTSATAAPTAQASRGANAVREAMGAARRGAGAAASGESQAGGSAQAGPAGLTMDDSAVSDDDEDIEVSTDVGRGVIESVLGGKVIAETDD